MEPPGFEPGSAAYNASALTLGYHASIYNLLNLISTRNSTYFVFNLGYLVSYFEEEGVVYFCIQIRTNL